jgi:hypothetical protein
MNAGWFDVKEAELFGNELAEFYDARSRANQQKLIVQCLQKARQFKSSHKLNFYKKAKLGNAFKWKLREKGHDMKLVDLLTKDILLALR